MTNAGIYRITHTFSKKTYIGQSNSVGARLSNHRIMLKNGNHHCSALMELWHTHKGIGFVFELVECAEIDMKGVVLQRWLLEREQYHYKSLSQLGLQLNSSYPKLVHAKDSQMEMLQQHKDVSRILAAEAEDKRKILVRQLIAKEQEMAECQREIVFQEETLARTSGFFAFVLGRSNSVPASAARAALQPLYGQRSRLEEERFRIYSASSDLEQERRKNNSIARNLGSKQKIVRARVVASKKC